MSSKSRSLTKPAATAVDVEIVDPWERARQLRDGIQLALRMSLAGQVLLGHELATLKKDMGFGHGANKGGPSGHFVQTGKTWADLIKEKLGISYKSADRMIECFEAAKVRVKKIGHLGTLPDGEKKLELIFTARPMTLTTEDRERLAKVVDKLVDGETQKSLLEEFRLVKLHDSSGIGGDTSAHKKDKNPATMQQLALVFLKDMAESLKSIRADAEREKYFATLDLISSDEDTITLTRLERDLEATLADVRKAKAARKASTAA